jgi:hypothetical protein
LSTTETPQGAHRAAPWLGLAGLGALMVAAASMASQALPPTALAFLVAGLLAWAALAWIAPPAPDSLGALDPPAGRPRALPLVLSLAAAGLCWWRMPAEEFCLPGVTAWIAAIVFWLRAWRAPRRRVPKASSERPRAGWAARGALILIMAAAAWFHFHDLAGVPSNPVSDHAEEMLDLRDLLGGRHGIYFFRNLGIAPFHFYWTAAFLKLLGLPVHYVWLKAATAAFGLLLVPALYLAGAELGGVVLGLAAAGFTAWGKWPVSLARQGQEYDYAIPIAAFVLWALLRWLRRGDRGSLLAAGVAIAVGLATYTAFRVVPLLVPLAVVAALGDQRRRGRRRAAVGDGLLVAATSAIVFLPVLKFIVFGENREFFWARVVTRVTDVEKEVADSRLAVFADNLGNMAKAFHWKGASTWTVLSMYEPFLDVVTGALLLVGLVLALRHAASGSWRWTWLLPALLVLTLPSTLAIAYPNENPSLNRAGPAIPVVFLLVGLAFAYLWQGFLRERAALRIVGLSALLASAAFSIQQNARAYFDRLGASYDALIEHAMEMAAVIRHYQAEGVPIKQSYLLAVDFWVDARNIALELDDPRWADTNNIAPPKVPEDLTARPLVFIYRSSDTARVETLRRLYPGGTARILPQSHRDRDFGVYLVR